MRLLALLYGGIAYLFFFGTFLYAIWFVFTMGTEPAKGPLLRSLIINGGLLALFAVQHSIMARQWFKKAWTRVIPEPIERSTFVLAASACLFALITFWQPLPTMVWEVESQAGQWVLHGLAGLGWLTVLYSTFVLGHFDLFGLKQVWDHWRGHRYGGVRFQIPWIYRWLRHPLYLGFLVAFWSTPRMSYDHLFFAVVTTAYILVAIQLEEHDLLHIHGDDYAHYRRRVSMLFPLPGKSLPARDETRAKEATN